MKSFKEYRFEQNPKEKEISDKFINFFKGGDNSKIKTLSSIIFGWSNDLQTIPNDNLTEREVNICVSLIQWLGSPVGIRFLESSGFKLIDNNENK